MNFRLLFFITVCLSALQPVWSMEQTATKKRPLPQPIQTVVPKSSLPVLPVPTAGSCEPAKKSKTVEELPLEFRISSPKKPIASCPSIDNAEPEPPVIEDKTQQTQYTSPFIERNAKNSFFGPKILTSIKREEDVPKSNKGISYKGIEMALRILTTTASAERKEEYKRIIAATAQTQNKKIPIAVNPRALFTEVQPETPERKAQTMAVLCKNVQKKTEQNESIEQTKQNDAVIPQALMTGLADAPNLDKWIDSINDLNKTLTRTNIPWSKNDALALFSSNSVDLLQRIDSFLKAIGSGQKAVTEEDDDDLSTPQSVLSYIFKEDIKNWGLLDQEMRDLRQLVTALDKKGRSILHQAAACPDLSAEAIITLIEYFNLDPIQKDKEDVTPLHQAAKKGNYELLAEYIRHYKKVEDLRDKKGNTLLHYAAKQNDFQVASCLIQQYGIKIDSKNHRGETPLHIATNYGKIRMIVYLCRTHRASINAQNNRGQTALHYAVTLKILASLDELISLGADLNIKDAAGFTAFHTAARFKTSYAVKIIETLLDKHANWLEFNNDGNTALHEAAQCANVWAIKPLSPFLREVLNRAGLTPLEVAINEGHVETIRALLDAGAQLRWSTTEEPRGICLALNNPQVKALLLARLIERPENMRCLRDDCPVCIEPFLPQNTPLQAIDFDSFCVQTCCGKKLFHKKCLAAVRETTPFCPLCRVESPAKQKV